MKTFVVVFALVAVALAAPQNPDAAAETLKSVSDVGPESYSWEYETSNQIKANEQGQLKEIGTEKGIAAQGAFSYNAPDGTPVSVTYVADENGFQPQGAHLPVAPEVPEHVVRLLKFLEEHPPQQQ